MVSNARSGGKTWSSGSVRGRRRWGQAGLEWAANWASLVWWAEVGHVGRVARWAGKAIGAKIKDLNRWASDLIFELIARSLSLKLNISNWILN
jgi:hypothetical protein